MRDLLLSNGVFHTIDSSAPIASAVAIRAGRFLHVGDRAGALERLGGGRVDEIDLKGRCVLPGLIDAHLHLRWYAEALRSVDVETATLEEAVQRVGARAEATAAGAWIQGSGWNHNVWGAGALPDRGPLDRAAPRNPVALKAKSGHALWANGLALKAAGIHSGTADPPGGKIVRGAAGEPTGMLLENAMDLVQAAIPTPTTEQMADALLDAQSALHRVGLVGAHDYDSSLVLAALELLESRGHLSLRVVKGIPHELLSHAIALGLRTGFGGERLTVGAVKLFADGALGPQTAWMLEPYESGGGAAGNQRFGGTAAGTSSAGGSLGIPTLTEDQMFEDARRANAAGIACAIHAIGDGACRAVLNAFERASREQRRSAAGPAADLPLRNRMEHAQLVSSADLSRMARLGVIASMQPIHATSDMLIADRYWGARCAGAYAWRSLLQAGTTLAFGSDCPVERADPILGIHAAVTRRRMDGTPGPEGWRPEQRLSVEQAVRAFTLGAAEAAGQEATRGSIRAGKLADLTVLQADVFSIDLHEIRNAGIAATIAGGRVVYGQL